MRWRDKRRSTNVEDHRGRRAGKVAGIGGGAVVMALIVYFMTGDGRALQQAVQQQQQAPQQRQQQQSGAPRADDSAFEFVRTVLASTEDVWTQIFADAGQRYQAPQLNVFETQIRTACGTGASAMGPFYCPGDREIYLDLEFFDKLARMGGPGEFARAYVIGHEIAHHVQNVLGIEPKMRQLQKRNPRASNQLLVLLELQADCLAGVWAHKSHQQVDWLDPGDIEAGLRAAASIGDDTLQRNSGQAVQPGKFTHGSSEQRVRWFKTGLTTGEINSCDTWGEAGVQL